MSIRTMSSALVILLVLAIGFIAGNAMDRIAAQSQDRLAKNDVTNSQKSSARKSSGKYLLQSEGAKRQHGLDNDYGLGDNHVSKLPTYPNAGPGELTPFDLWRYGPGKDGPRGSSWSPPTLPKSWNEWVGMCTSQK